jgi:hypothetical protein
VDATRGGAMTLTVEVWSGVEGLDGHFSFASKKIIPVFM